MTARRALSLLALAVLSPVVALLGCGQTSSPWPPGVPVRVVVTIPPLASFVKNVAGSHAAVRCLCTETGPHHYEYNVQDTQQFREANLFFAVGLTLDNKFADPLHANAKHVPYRQLGELLPAQLKLRDEEHDEHGKEKDKGKDDHGHAHGDIDPHAWLGIEQAIAMVETIRAELAAVDAAHAADYDSHAKKYVERLKKLLADGRAQIEPKKSKKIVSFHDSLRYFEKSFGIEIVDVIELTAGDTPTPNQLADLVEQCNKHKVQVIAVEPQYPRSGAAETLRRELAKPANNLEVKLVEVDPLETADPKGLEDPGWYEAKMRRNIEELARALP
jgi:ABC-type Zn uptake system ZnuABC Zn-binding protein ZnuA